MKHLSEGLIKQRGITKIIPKQLLKEYDIVQLSEHPNAGYYIYLSWNSAKRMGVNMSRFYNGQHVFALLYKNGANIYSSFLTVEDYLDDLSFSPDLSSTPERWIINKIFRIKDQEIINELKQVSGKNQSAKLINPGNLEYLTDYKSNLIWTRK